MSFVTTSISTLRPFLHPTVRGVPSSTPTTSSPRAHASTTPQPRAHSQPPRHQSSLLQQPCISPLARQCSAAAAHTARAAQTARALPPSQPLCAATIGPAHAPTADAALFACAASRVARLARRPGKRVQRCARASLRGGIRKTVARHGCGKGGARGRRGARACAGGARGRLCCAVVSCGSCFICSSMYA